MQLDLGFASYPRKCFSGNAGKCEARRDCKMQKLKVCVLNYGGTSMQHEVYLSEVVGL